MRSGASPLSRTGWHIHDLVTAFEERRRGPHRLGQEVGDILVRAHEWDNNLLVVESGVLLIGRPQAAIGQS